LLLVSLLQPSDAFLEEASSPENLLAHPCLCGLSLVWFLNVLLRFFIFFLVAFALWAISAGWFVLALSRKTKVLGRPQLIFIFVLSLLSHPVHAMEPLNTAEIGRAVMRHGTNLIASRTVRPETRAGREKLLAKFGTWLWTHHRVQLSVLLSTKPADPEEICKWLVLYGQDCYASGKTYGSFSETINAVAAARPPIKRQLAPAWDLAFAWLCDEPHRHHPALPASVLLAVALTWGWCLEAGILALTWNGILRIGETLMAQRKDLVLIKDSMPGINFILLRIKMPKTRGRSAKHQAARVDPADMIQLITGVFEHLRADSKLWPFSASTLRKRFNNFLIVVGFEGGDHGGQGGDTSFAANRGSGTDPSTWKVALLHIHRNLPAGGDGNHIHTEVVTICQAKDFEACCSFSPSAGTGPCIFGLWHLFGSLATTFPSTSFRGAWVILGGVKWIDIQQLPPLIGNCCMIDFRLCSEKSGVQLAYIVTSWILFWHLFALQECFRTSEHLFFCCWLSWRTDSIHLRTSKLPWRLQIARIFP